MENLPTYRLTQSGPETQEILNQVNLNTVDIEQLKRLYQALNQSDPEIIEPTDTWPVANPEENVIYRVIDRVNTPPQYYTDYMWNGTSMVPMAQYNNAIDNEPTANSNNLVKSGGVYSFVHANGGAYDISAAHAVGGVLATYDDLADALGTNGANVPAAVRKGGMSIKFVLSSDNKYVRFNYLLADATTNSKFVNVANWQGVDDEPTAGSDNLVKSGGVYEAFIKETENACILLKDFSHSNTGSTQQYSVLNEAISFLNSHKSTVIYTKNVSSDVSALRISQYDVNGINLQQNITLEKNSLTKINLSEEAVSYKINITSPSSEGRHSIGMIACFGELPQYIYDEVPKELKKDYNETFRVNEAFIQSNQDGLCLESKYQKCLHINGYWTSYDGYCSVIYDITYIIGKVNTIKILATGRNNTYNVTYVKDYNLIAKSSGELNSQVWQNNLIKRAYEGNTSTTSVERTLNIDDSDLKAQKSNGGRVYMIITLINTSVPYHIDGLNVTLNNILSTLNSKDTELGKAIDNASIGLVPTIYNNRCLRNSGYWISYSGYHSIIYKITNVIGIQDSIKVLINTHSNVYRYYIIKDYKKIPYTSEEVDAEEWSDNVIYSYGSGSTTTTDYVYTINLNSPTIKDALIAQKAIGDVYVVISILDTNKEYDVPVYSDKIKHIQEFVDSNSAPRYYFPYLDNKVKEMYDCFYSNGEIYDNFIFITDPHWSLNYKVSPLIIEYLMSKGIVNKVINGGDICSIDSLENGVFTQKDELAFDIDFQARIKKYGHVYPAIGNHDYNGNDNVGNFWKLSNLQLRNLFFQNIGAYVHYNPSDTQDKDDPTKKYTNSDNLYYWFDIEDRKIRYIFFSLYYTYGIQFDWLITNAILTCPAGYNIVYVNHCPAAINTSNTTESAFLNREKNLYDLILATKNKGIFTFNSQTYDFSNLEGNVVALFCGHTHIDSYTNVDGVAFINQSCDKSVAGRSQQETISEQFFGYYNLDISNNVIKRIGIGAAQNIIFHLNRVTTSVGGDTITFASSLSGTITWTSYDAEERESVTDGHPVPATTLSTISSSGVLTPVGAGQVVVCATNENSEKEYFNVLITA